MGLFEGQKPLVATVLIAVAAIVGDKLSEPDAIIKEPPRASNDVPNLSLGSLPALNSRGTETSTSLPNVQQGNVHEKPGNYESVLKDLGIKLNPQSDLAKEFHSYFDQGYIPADFIIAEGLIEGVSPAVGGLDLESQKREIAFLVARAKAVKEWFGQTGLSEEEVHQVLSNPDNIKKMMRAGAIFDSSTEISFSDLGSVCAVFNTMELLFPDKINDETYEKLTSHLNRYQSEITDRVARLNINFELTSEPLTILENYQYLEGVDRNLKNIERNGEYIKKLQEAQRVFGIPSDLIERELTKLFYSGMDQDISQKLDEALQFIRTHPDSPNGSEFSKFLNSLNSSLGTRRGVVL